MESISCASPRFQSPDSQHESPRRQKPGAARTRSHAARRSQMNVHMHWRMHLSTQHRYFCAVHLLRFGASSPCQLPVMRAEAQAVYISNGVVARCSSSGTRGAHGAKTRSLAHRQTGRRIDRSRTAREVHSATLERDAPSVPTPSLLG